MSFEDQEYHRRRSEMELEVAVSAEDQASAIAHLELARLHRARRQPLTRQRDGNLQGVPFIFRPDKEA